MIVSRKRWNCRKVYVTIFGINRFFFFMLNIMLKAASAPPTTQEMIDAAAVRLVHLWRRIDQLGCLPLTQSDRDEVRLQKMLIKSYILFLNKMKQIDGPLRREDQKIFDDLTGFIDEANRAIDEAGMTH